VIGRPDPDWQNAVVALIVPRDGVEPEAEGLRSWCAARLTAYKVPKRVEFTSELPRTPSGKLRRRELA
jgi:acyl-coenzyme A synthetase/AMP-(fatty) acid ligase